MVGLFNGGKFVGLGGGGDFGEERRRDAMYRKRTGHSREEAG